MGGCQNYGPFLGSLHIRCCILIWIQKGGISLTTTHMEDEMETGFIWDLYRDFIDDRRNFATPTPKN